MAKRHRENTNASSKIFSGLFFVAGLVILVSIGISLGKETYKKRQVQKEIEGLQSQIKQLDQENGDLANLISYLSTQEFQEKEAREKLNLQKDNEQMIVLKKELAVKQESQKSSDQPEDITEDNSPNWQKWMKYFFEKRS